MTAQQPRHQLADFGEETPVELAVSRIIENAADWRASDLFFASDEKAMMISIRQMGILQPVRPFSNEYGKRLMSHLKAMSGIDISDRHRPTEGRWIFEREGNAPIDLRVNCMPTTFGEDIAVRLLDRHFGLIPLGELGLSNREFGAVTSLLRNAGGLILVTGPTGSGKSTTLYSCLNFLNDGKRKINTLEDPVEYMVSGLRQSQVNVKMGVDFPELLAACLRQSPDVIMIGEIRDPRTAQTAVRAANSGHLVLATLHSPVALKAVSTMVTLGVRSQNFAEGLLGIISQRLVRKLCANCCVRIEMSDSTFLEDIRGILPEDWDPAMYQPGACEQCHHTGYVKPLCLPEVFTANSKLRHLIAEGAPLAQLQEEADKADMISFRQSAMLRVANGDTTIEDVMRVIPFDDLRDRDDELEHPLEPLVQANVAPVGSA